MIGQQPSPADKKALEKITTQISPQIIQLLEIILPYHIGQGRMKVKTPDPTNDLKELKSGVLFAFTKLTDALNKGELTPLKIEDKYYKAIKFAAEYNALSQLSQKKLIATQENQSSITQEVTQLLDDEYPKYVQLGKNKLAKDADIKIEMLNLQQRLTMPLALTINDSNNKRLTQEALLSNLITSILASAEYEVLKEHLEKTTQVSSFGSS